MDPEPRSVGGVGPTEPGELDRIDPEQIDPDPVDPTSAPLAHRPYRAFRPDPRLLAAVSAGGALGAPARYGMTLWLGATAGGFPWATLWINLSGSFLLGAVLIFALERLRPSRYLRAFLGTGFCGAYTTMSGFAVEVDLLVRDGHHTTAAAYIVASLAGGLLAVWAGMRLARLIPIRSTRSQLTPEEAP
jgi:CrcB protein